jgi:hypothetical protein
LSRIEKNHKPKRAGIVILFSHVPPRITFPFSLYTSNLGFLAFALFEIELENAPFWIQAHGLLACSFQVSTNDDMSV